LSEAEDELRGRDEVDNKIRSLQEASNSTVARLVTKFPKMVEDLNQVEEEILDSKVQLTTMMASLLQLFRFDDIDRMFVLADLVESLTLDVEKELLEHESEHDVGGISTVINVDDDEGDDVEENHNVVVGQEIANVD
jgi:hypothetical protein